MQHPQLVAVDGGQTVDFDAQEREAWAVMADACAEALTALHPQHPERHQFLTMLHECRRAGQQRRGLGLSQMA
jgi:hypothetical protein